MPRIDPQQLLTCLEILLTPSGGIKSQNEVQRLANLMTKFSKKLVSKCIYILILKNSEHSLLDLFMSAGGWNLLHVWFQDAHTYRNWPLTKELLELLLMTPVDVERLKQNNLPKLVKSLTKLDEDADVQRLSISLVEEWLKLVKDVTRHVQPQPEVASTNVDAANSKEEEKMTVINHIDSAEASLALPESKSETENDKDKENNSSNSSSSKSSQDKTKSSSSKSTSKDRSRDKDRHRGSSSKTSSSSSSKDKSSSRDKDRHRSSSKSSSSSSSKHKSSSSSSSKSSSKSSSSSDKKSDKEKQADKDRETLSKVQPNALQKVGRIPKKTDDAKKDDVKKPTFSVEVRKKTEEKPKTVKVFNSKMRSTGLLEEVKPPPPRSATKKTPAPIPAVLPVKRSSPVRDAIPPPEKKSRLLEGTLDRPGGVKLIPPKPKPAILQESDIFMDALTASASANKKEPKKRKRRTSNSKDASPPPAAPGSPPAPTSPAIKAAPANFYQDTLQSSIGDDKEERTPTEENDNSNDKEDSADDTERTRTDENGLRGVLCHGKRRRPKRSIRWKADADLVEIQYFELDENERVNVTKPFGDMARREMTSEREALRARKLPNEDNMDAQVEWSNLIEIEVGPYPVELGSKSLEKDIQFAREKRVLQALYFNSRIPDSPAEPDVESIHSDYKGPIIIPLEDPDNPDSDTTVHPWPEPKEAPPEVQQPVAPFVNNIPQTPFIGMNNPAPNNNFRPQFPAPFMPNANIMPNQMRPPWNGVPNGIPPEIMLQQMNQVPEQMGPGPMGPGPMGPMQPHMMHANSFEPPPFPPPMFPGGPGPHPNNFMRGRGGFRRGGPGPWVRMGGPGPGPMPPPPNPMWNGPPNAVRGMGGPMRGNIRFCLNVKKHGYCRNRDTCQFMHPN